MQGNPISRTIWKLGQSKYLRGMARTLRINNIVNSVFKKSLVIFSEDPTTIQISGVSAQYRVTSVSEFSIFNKQSERQILEDILGRVEDDDVFWDVGANIGLYTCLVTQSLSETVAFEPFPKNASRLEENISLNKLKDKSSVYQYALSDQTRGGKLSVVNENVGTGQNRISNNKITADEIEIEEKRGDNLIRKGIPTPTVLKIDVEGAEMQVIEGLGDILSSARLIYCEVHNDESHDNRLDEIRKTLSEYGFEVELILDRGDQNILRGTKS